MITPTLPPVNLTEMSTPNTNENEIGDKATTNQTPIVDTRTVANRAIAGEDCPNTEYAPIENSISNAPRKALCKCAEARTQ